MPKTYLNPISIHPPVGAYSHTITVTDMTLVFIAGQVAVDIEGNLVGKGDLGAQTEQVFKNLNAALEAVGATFDNLVKITFYIVNYKRSYRAALLEVYQRYSPENPPTSTLVGVQSLASEDFLIEIEAVAAIDNN